MLLETLIDPSPPSINKHLSDGDGSCVCYVVATPIGNLRDISLRALDVLSSVALVYAEDTRHSKKLLSQFDIQTPLRSLHEHNEQAQTEKLIQELKKGVSIAIISDAGTPLISDPGYTSIRQISEAGFRVVPIPGACAAIAALSAAGLPTDRFLFKGFLPAKALARQQALVKVKSEPGTLIFYEAKHRILEMLKDVSEVLGSTRRLVLCRELTKQFESFYRGTVTEVIQEVASCEDAQKGEFVVLVEGYQAPSAGLPVALNAIAVDQLVAHLREFLPDKHVAQVLAKLTHLGKRDWYAYLMK